MSIMNKLAKKGFLLQDKSGTAYIYSPLSAMLKSLNEHHRLRRQQGTRWRGGTDDLTPAGLQKKLTAEEVYKLEELLKKKK